jgi:GAF domain-containing protein
MITPGFRVDGLSRSIVIVFWRLKIARLEAAQGAELIVAGGSLAKPRSTFMSDRTRVLTIDDLSGLAALSASAHEPQELYAAVDGLVQKVIGHRLFTIMRVHEAAMEVERIYSSNTVAYPVGGRKQKRGTLWSRVVLDKGEVFIARTPDEVRAAFDDHALIFSLGVGSIMNVPIAYRGRRLGIMNISNEAGWFRGQDAAAGELIAVLLVPALLVD